MITEFKGFSRELTSFLEGLAQNNTREWFQEHRPEYEKHFLPGAFSLTNTMGKELAKLVPDLQYDPKIDRSVFRLNRDVRFSKVKVPYKTHLGIVFWKGPYDARQMNPGFYFQLEPYQLYLAAGAWIFTPEMLAEYRRSLLDNKYGSEFAKIAAALKKANITATSEFMLKKYPKGFKQEHPLAEWSKYKSLYVYQSDEGGLPDIVFKQELIDYCLAFYKQTVSLLNWEIMMAYRAFKST
ncbi:MAG: DUF2461 domain-containing protein [Deferribacteraceae bacterium]|nr:DUF2461 domain-containing protein [Deferribacteraceae bacterium]